MRIKSTYTEYTGPGTTNTLRTGVGEIHALLASSTAPGGSPLVITLYDNTAGSGNVLFRICVSEYSPQNIFFPGRMPLKFSTGLTVVTPANTSLFAIVAY
jgi:hypothetical protein